MTIQDVAQARGAFHKAAAGNRIYHGMTAVAGVAPGTAIGTTAPIALYNPLGSGVYLSVLAAHMAYVSGTIGVGSVLHCVNIDPAAAATTGTAITKVGGRLVQAAGQGRLFTTATLPVTPTVVRPFCSLSPWLATTVLAPYRVEDLVNGVILIPPGCTWSLESVAAAGTTPLVTFGVTWEEIPEDTL